MNQKLILTIGISLLVHLSSMAQQTPSSTTTTQEQSIPYTVKTYTLQKFEQSCCAYMVEYALEEVNGFVKVEADIKKHQVTVWFDDTKCTEEDIKEAINRTNYKIIEP